MTRLRLWNCALFILFVLFLGLYTQELNRNQKLQRTLDAIPFHPNLCKFTGIVHNWFIIGKHGRVIDRADFLLDCSDVYGYEHDLETQGNHYGDKKYFH